MQKKEFDEFGRDLHEGKYQTEKVLKCDHLLQEYGFTEKDFGLPPRLKK